MQCMDSHLPLNQPDYVYIQNLTSEVNVKDWSNVKDSPAANDKDDDLLFMRGHSLVDSQQIQDPTEAGGEHKRKQKQTFLYLAAALDAIAVTTAMNMKRCKKFVQLLMLSKLSWIPKNVKYNTPPSPSHSIFGAKNHFRGWTHNFVKSFCVGWLPE